MIDRLFFAYFAIWCGAGALIGAVTAHFALAGIFAAFATVSAIAFGIASIEVKSIFGDDE